MNTLIMVGAMYVEITKIIKKKNIFLEIRSVYRICFINQITTL